MDDQTKAGPGKGTKVQRSTTTEAGTSPIDLKIPGRPEYGVVVRLTAAAVGGRLGLSYDDIEDLKVAVGGGGSPPVPNQGPPPAPLVSVAPGPVDEPNCPPP